MTSKLINGNEINASKIDVEKVGTKIYERMNIKIGNNQDSKRKKETKVNKVQVNSKRPKLNLTLYQREEIISKIGDERHFLFGKLMDGITREKRDEYKGNFLKWCEVRSIISSINPGKKLRIIGIIGNYNAGEISVKEKTRLDQV